MVEVEVVRDGQFPARPPTIPAETLVEIDDKFIEPDEDIRKYDFTRESKQTQLTRREADLLEAIGDCKSLTGLLQKKLKTEKNPQPLGELLNFLKSKQVFKTVVNCGVEGFTARLSRTHEHKLTENIKGLDDPGKKGLLSRIRP